jgi:hypothetical protein
LGGVDLSEDFEAYFEDETCEYLDPELYDPDEETLPPGELELIFENSYINLGPHRDCEAGPGNHVDAMDRVLLELDMTDALRPSELFALLLDWKRVRPDPSPETFIFTNTDGGFLDTGNYRKRVLNKLAQVLGLPKLNFQVIRRTIATLTQHKGSAKDGQGLFRHSRATKTFVDVYQQVQWKGVRRLAKNVNRELRKTPQKRPPKWPDFEPARGRFRLRFQFKLMSIDANFFGQQEVGLA